jgi:hypothetical protein
VKYGPLTCGDVREDGYIFRNYLTKKKTGKTNEQWLSPASFRRFCIIRTFTKAKERAALKKLPFDIDIDYLVSIFPDDEMCPALRTKMHWGAKCRENSPSLDRHVPSLGYVKGNVSFISSKANWIKSNATTEELFSVANYMKELN